jgi:hypothetical protein
VPLSEAAAVVSFEARRTPAHAEARASSVACSLSLLRELQKQGDVTRDSSYSSRADPGGRASRRSLSPRSASSNQYSATCVQFELFPLARRPENEHSGDDWSTVAAGPSIGRFCTNISRGPTARHHLAVADLHGPFRPSDRNAVFKAGPVLTRGFRPGVGHVWTEGRHVASQSCCSRQRAYGSTKRPVVRETAQAFDFAHEEEVVVSASIVQLMNADIAHHTRDGNTALPGASAARPISRFASSR